MKTKEFMNGIAGMSMAELNDELVAAKKELFNLRFQNATNQLDNTSRIKEVRRNIARIQTAMFCMMINWVNFLEYGGD